jgi:hypothetical protein
MLLLCAGIVTTYILLIYLLARIPVRRQPKPSPVRALCCLCLRFHDGTGTHCEACDFAYYPDGVTYFQVEQLVDGVQYRTEK